MTSFKFIYKTNDGRYLLFSKPKHFDQTEKQFQQNTQETVKNEVAKIKTDDKSYSFTKYVWARLLILSVICFFIFNKDYFQGLMLGFVTTFLGMLLIDAFLHHRLKLYLTALYKIVN